MLVVVPPDVFEFEPAFAGDTSKLRLGDARRGVREEFPRLLGALEAGEEPTFFVPSWEAAVPVPPGLESVLAE